MRFFYLLQAALAGVLAAVAYGIVHDQITVRIYPPYFTEWHPYLVDTGNLTLVALAWGFVATWWVGLPLGLVLGLAGCAGRRPVAPFRLLLRYLVWTVAITGLLALLTGLAAWFLGLKVSESLMGPIEDRSADAVHRFSTVLAIHNTSYNASVVVALVVAVLLYRSRRLQAR